MLSFLSLITEQWLCEENSLIFQEIHTNVLRSREASYGEDEFYFMQVKFEVMVEYLNLMARNYLKRSWYIDWGVNSIVEN